MIIGGGNNIIHGGNNNWNNWGINNRPGGNWANNNWNQWHNNWHDHCINDHHNWYHGCWNNHWGGGWYAPLAWGAVGWGLGSWYGSGYGGAAYYNPYYVAAPAVPYDYSQPVVVNNYIPVDTGAVGGTVTNTIPQTAATPPPPNAAAMAEFDQGMADFKAGNYQQAITRFDAALKQLPGDPVVHEVRALALFAVGNYQAAGASLNSLLATAPGMDWTTMASLYGNVDDYTKQLRALETYCKSNPKDAAAYFVLAYQYLVTGSQDSAISALKVVVREQPKDVTAKRMLDSLVPPNTPPATATASTALPPPPPTAEATTTAANAGETDLVGTWRAKAGDSAIDLTIGDDSQFTWKASQPGKPAIELKGDLVATSDTIVLDSPEQGSMVGRVKSAGPNKWQFAINGGPPDDPGLSFERVK